MGIQKNRESPLAKGSLDLISNIQNVSYVFFIA